MPRQHYAICNDEVSAEIGDYGRLKMHKVSPGLEKILFPAAIGRKIMKKLILIGAMILVFIAAGCATDLSDTATGPDADAQQQESETAGSGGQLSSEFYQTLSDWMLGTDYGITDAKVDTAQKQIIITISEEKQSELEDYEYDDIAASFADMLTYSGADASGYFLVWPDGLTTYLSGGTAAENQEQDTQTQQTAQAPTTSEDTVNLIFIHHSVGENWLNYGLCEMLNDNGYHVADTYYGWNEMGDRTDTTDWPDWFNDAVMPSVYSEMGTMTANNTIDPAPGENEIVMFKSCFPNSDVGNSITDEQEIYNSLLPYFSEHPDKMFILVTPPPMQNISSPKKTRELANWLVDGWLSDYNTGNVFVFDFYNVLTAPDNHHYFDGTNEVHNVTDPSNTLFYDDGGDDHPNSEGSTKAAGQFISLLNYWYGQFKGR